MRNLKDIRLEFEKLVGAVLAENGYNILPAFMSRPSPFSELGAPDFLVAGPDNQTLPVEVKLLPLGKVPLSLLRDASSVTARWKNLAVKAKPLLVYGSEIAPSMREWAQQEFGIDIWDRNMLLEKATSNQRSLDGFFQWLDGEQEKERAARPGTAPIDAFDTPKEVPATPVSRGENLIKKLEGVLPGKQNAKRYEEVCQEIITYTFGDDLRDGRSQKRTIDNMNIYDLVYRVSPKNEFWATLTRDFRARVVLFECKNYGKPIGPMQVFTTERYLSAGALRPICFVLSRKPANGRAVQAAFGAMRESGKLLVFLSDADLHAMLRAKDAQLTEGGTKALMEANDPTEVLDQKIYDFIAAIPR
jgi:hypothetical protein